jgi:membrane-bound ClpP family serine protease
VGLAAACFFGAAALHADPPPDDGLFITVPSPLTSERVNRIKAQTNRALQRPDRHIRKLIYDFNAGRQTEGQASSTPDYGPCHDLAEFLLELQSATTVAFVHNDVSGHTVLPVLACKEIVMSSEARLGPANLDPGRPLRKDQVQFYDDIATSRGWYPAIVLKVLDKNVEVVEGTRQGAPWYADKRRLAEEVKQGFVPTHPEPVLVAGNLESYTAAKAQKFGLCKLIKESRPEVAEAYHLSPSSLREDPLEGRDPVAVRFIIREPVTRALEETLHRRVRQVIARGANFLIFQLECSTGDTQVARDLAEYFRDLKDDRGSLPVMTVAYIPQRAPGAAVFLAMGCTEIVMRKSAEIGGFDSVVYQRPGPGLGKVEVEPEQYAMLRESLIGLAKEQGYPPLLARGMLDRSVTIYRVYSQKERSEWKLITEEELRADQAGPRKWGNKTLIKPGGPNGRFLTLNAQLAKEVGLAREVADDAADVYRMYGLERVQDAGSDFLYELARFLRHPLVSFFLIVIGITCLFLELKMAGVGLPGVTAALCFVLYFWAHSQLAGQITMLAVLLFLLGLILIGLEIFVLPGFGIPGISGIVLVVVSLALATVEKKPETTQEWLSFTRAIGAVGLGLVGAVGLAIVAAWYLPHVPYANRLVLKPPNDEDDLDSDAPLAGEESAHAEAAALLGAIGVAATALRPAGIARFGDAFVDVISEGSYVPAGNRVQVIEIEGNRVVVKEV